MEDLTKDYSHSLADLKDQEERFQNKRRFKWDVKNEAQKEYEAKKIKPTPNTEKPKDLDQIIGNIEKGAAKKRRAKKIVPLCDYNTAKVLIWRSYKALAQESDVTLNITPQLKEILPILTAYFTGNPNEHVEPSKGIFLYGPCGSGKTFLMKAIQKALFFAEYKKRKFKITSVPRIFDDLLGSDNFSLSGYYSENRCFDDLGFDNKSIKHYGNEINPMQTIFTHRYNAFLSSGITTHATSNLPIISTSEIEGLDKRFDERIISRFREMFNLIVLDGEDFRRS